MRNLIDFVQRHIHWLVFLALEVVSLVLLFRHNSYQGSVIFSSANTVTGKINELASGIGSYFSLKEENIHLEAENEALRKQVLLLEALERNRQAAVADSMVRFGLLPEFHVVSGQVVNATLHRPNNLLTINLGEADGVRPEMGVVCSSGIVGIVYLSSSHYSVVIPLLNTKSNISCRVDTTNYFGTLQWQHGDPDISYLNGLPRHAKVKVGDIIKTNGYSAIFPEGIPVGKVTKISDTPDGMSYSLTVRLFTDFKSLRNISVITNYTQPERRQLEQKADSMARRLDN